MTSLATTEVGRSIFFTRARCKEFVMLGTTFFYNVEVTLQLYALQLTGNVFYVTKYFIKTRICL